MKPVYIIFFILLFLPHENFYADSIYLSGTIMDESGKPISGADVYLYRNSLRTSTDAKGKFELTGNSQASSVHRKRVLYNHFRLRDNVLYINQKIASPIGFSLYDFRGHQIYTKQYDYDKSKICKLLLPEAGLAQGLYVVVVKYGTDRATIRYLVSGRNSGYTIVSDKALSELDKTPLFTDSQASEFSDILVISAVGTQTLRRPVSAPVEKEITLQLMPIWAGNITPGIPFFTDTGGNGDVTTYGSVVNPEFSQGGACNYGSTGIKYYAAINVNQLPGDLKGQWQGGHICGRCARVRLRTKEGDVRTTVVRIMDKCADDNCGIDLGGAPAGEIMKTQPGRYSGEWEWVNCDGADGVSDALPSLYIKTGSNEWWSLVQVRNGNGSVEKIRVRKSGTEEWQYLAWATEAENYFKVPVEILQDSNNWEIEVHWNIGKPGTLLLQGKKLAFEDSSYQLHF